MIGVVHDFSSYDMSPRPGSGLVLMGKRFVLLSYPHCVCPSYRFYGGSGQVGGSGPHQERFSCSIPSSHESQWSLSLSLFKKNLTTVSDIMRKVFIVGVLVSQASFGLGAIINATEITIDPATTSTTEHANTTKAEPSATSTEHPNTKKAEPEPSASSETVSTQGFPVTLSPATGPESQSSTDGGDRDEKIEGATDLEKVLKAIAFCDSEYHSHSEYKEARATAAAKEKAQKVEHEMSTSVPSESAVSGWMKLEEEDAKKGAALLPASKKVSEHIKDAYLIGRNDFDRHILRSQECIKNYGTDIRATS